MVTSLCNKLPKDEVGRGERDCLLLLLHSAGCALESGCLRLIGRREWLCVQVEAAVRHALHEAARRSEGSLHRSTRASGNMHGDDSSVHSSGSAGDSVRDGMSFRQVGASRFSSVHCNGLVIYSCAGLLAGSSQAGCRVDLMCSSFLSSPPQFVRMLRAGSADCLYNYDDRHGSLGSSGSLGSLAQAR